MTEPKSQRENGGEIPGFGPNAFEAWGDAFAEAAKRHSDDPGHQCVELCPICRTADVIRATAPPELREQWQQLQRDALLTLRAFIDHYLERSDEQRPAGVRVEDIPIE
jgi:hypothetical protein